MGKRRKPLLKLNDRPSVQTKVISIKPSDGLPPYKRYFDSKNGIRFFFEPPQTGEEVATDFAPHVISFCYAGDFSLGKSSISFFPRAESVLGEFSKDLARLVVLYATEKTGTVSVLRHCNTSLNRFVDFAESKKVNVNSFADITQRVLGSFSEYLDFNDLHESNFSSLKRLLLIHPVCIENGLKKVMHTSSKSVSRSEQLEVDLDKHLNDGYSDRELIQILAYTYYEIDIFRSRLAKTKSIKADGLGPNDLPFKELKTNNEKLTELLTTGSDGYDILIDNIILYHHPRYLSNTKNSCDYLDRLRNRAFSLNLVPQYDDFLCYIRKDCWGFRNFAATGKTMSKTALKQIPFWKVLNGQDYQFTFSLMIYVMITTGLNFSVIKTWRREMNGKPWYENLDRFMGCDDNSSPRDKGVVMMGYKKKTGVASAAKIPTSIPINSPLYRYLKDYDDANDPNRTQFFTTAEETLNQNRNEQFLRINPVYNHDGERLIKLIPSMFRKVFAGHKLLSLLGEVNSPDELIFKLKESLNHSKFDTTLYSYIMKAGVGNQILDSAIVALTSDLLEKSVKFQGNIKEQNERSSTAKSVYLCDCTDPSNPTHDLPINNSHCRKYDMCLGCERSEVYAEHVPTIYFRVLQYEEFREKSHDVYKASMEDRHNIAIDTLERFKVEHSNGLEIYNSAYVEATDNFSSGKLILPPILQIEKL